MAFGPTGDATCLRLCARLSIPANARACPHIKPSRRPFRLSALCSNRVEQLRFRHITGIKTWDTFAKARYVSRLIETGRSIAEVEEVIGDSVGTVKKLYQAFVTYRQITSDLQMEGKPVETNFSLLEVALGVQPIKQYLGIGRTLPTHPIQEVVPNNKLENLREVVSWVFGEPQEGRERVITDSREIG